MAENRLASDCADPVGRRKLKTGTAQRNNPIFQLFYKKENTVDFDTKIKIVLRKGLEPWQELNVVAFLMSGIGATQNIVGAPYRDKSGKEYLPMSQQPIMIHSGTADAMNAVLQKTLARGGIAINIYTQELFTTYNDEDNRASVAGFATEELNLVGVAMRGKKNTIDKLFKEFPLHK